MGIRLAAAMLAALGCGFAQSSEDPLQCVRDGAGNRICIRLKPDNNTCGYTARLFGAQAQPIACNDAMVEKFGPRGNLVFSVTLGGESEDAAREVAVDARGNVAVLGTTWSTRFPVTRDAVQSRYAGPAPSVPSTGRLMAGGDLFLTVLSPQGEVTYSTFLGSPGNDEILEIHEAVTGQWDVLVRTPDLQFPVDLAPSVAGPVLLTVDVARHSVMRARYLPAADTGRSATYSATWLESGAAQVVTPDAVFTYARDGRSLTRALLASPAFAGIPVATLDGEGDLWLTGTTAAGQAQVIRLADSRTEAARWTVPSYGGSPAFSAPFFGPKSLVYLGGTLGYRGTLRTTTANALLRAPCRESAAFLAVIERDGDLRMLSYAEEAPRFSLAKSGSVAVLAEWDLLNRVPVDLTSKPKAGCVSDGLRAQTLEPFAVGQLVRVRGGNFGPSTPRAAALDHGRFPTRLDTLRVRFDGIDAPILAASPGEALVAIPYRVRTNDDTASLVIEDDGERSAEFLLRIEAASPQPLGDAVNEYGTLNSRTAPAAWGSTVTVYVTGAGAYTPSLGDGEVAGQGLRLELPVSVSVQTTGPAEESAEVVYAGALPGVVGAVSRVTFRLPRARLFAYESVVVTVRIGSASFPLTVWVR